MANKTLIQQILELASQFLVANKPKIQEAVTKAATDAVSKPVQPVIMALAVPTQYDQVNWSDPSSKIAKYFTVKDAIMLREWNRLGNETDGLDLIVKKNLFGVFQKMDIIREFLGVPVFIKSAWRPSAYNVAIGGAIQSAHMANTEYGAVDFWCDIDGDGAKNGKDCDDIKAKLMPNLEGWGLRMENNGVGATWVHVDTKPVAGGHRFFKP